MRINLHLPLFLLFCLQAIGQFNPLVVKDSVAQMAWVENHYANMTLEERIGQLFMVSVASNQSKSATDRVRDLVASEGIGGVIFLVGGPVQQAQLTNAYQAVSKVPLLIGSDAEWGMAMRLDSTYAFPWNMTLGAIQDSAIVEKVGHQIGKHAKRLGVHINFAPDLDVNNNPQNPIIGNRSFGEDPKNVAEKGRAFVRGMEKAGVLTSGKHFPGHGDTATDSHKSLPIINSSLERLDSIELYPFKEVMRAGLSSTMVAHLDVPSLEPREGHPSTLSKRIVTGVLQNQLGFKGLVITDALNMKAVSDFAPEGEVELQAFLAGNDLLLMPENVLKAKETFIKAYHDGVVTEERLARSVKKILMAKYKAGLYNYEPVRLENLHEDLNGIENDVVYEEAIEAAITVAKNNFSLMPIKKLDNKKIAYVHFGDDPGAAFHEALNKYYKVTHIKARDIARYKKELAKYNLVIIGFHKDNSSPWKGYKFSKNELFWLEEISRLRTSNTILALFARPYALLDVLNFDTVDGLVVGYQNSRIAQKKVAELIFGAIGASGKLPVSAHGEFPVGTGVDVEPIQRLGYSIPERVGMSSELLAEVDTLVQHGLDSLMFPGAQVLIARKGKVVYDKNFGKPTYQSKEHITEQSIYDLASLTKILSTLPLIMKMEEEGEIALNDTFGELIPEYADTELKEVSVLKALSHYGRLPSWIAFYLDTLNKDRKPSSEFYRRNPSEAFPYKVAEHLYLTRSYKDSIYNRIGRQSLKSNRYRYSDVGYYVFKEYIEDTYKRPINELIDEFLYKPMGLQRTTFNPLKKFSKEEIVPSEEDDYYRYQTVQGYVHDMGAAMQGGVGGHAGLFSTANEVAKIMQMYLQGGYYGGERFFNPRTVKRFNTCYFCNKNVRRGVGFDKPQLEEKGPTCGCVSRQSFGHSGFTGTYTWADPEEEIVYVFLSNRTYPSATNTLLIKSGLRTRIQQAIYDSIIN
ncbi:glycoside hydrolase family 3 N-terminal domain-containing protein [Flagellimonas halotolerans]|uniref:beta-N-acetylhexosaminidase n=1 Tax=Flagellimonas halotolerans TaxID=3112164 RepID=A0ABU6ISG1_9FLAO|nr:MULTISPECIES: glycoside hydrolase family 3 N-terminal domain-containing protein [unclassified Allomuricauda]MEC3966134.1 glycoside hydrolase family 3 N-terminal domain-containing protein [Muricauda sp. SYSU M86414]MEC4265999.1 glycoside hydrolase family 3 N-terminal domain-containing protein [Muricauda sp. SYSU M84420]